MSSKWVKDSDPLLESMSSKRVKDSDPLLVQGL